MYACEWKSVRWCGSEELQERCIHARVNVFQSKLQTLPIADFRAAQTPDPAFGRGFGMVSRTSVVPSFSVSAHDHGDKIEVSGAHAIEHTRTHTQR